MTADGAARFNYFAATQPSTLQASGPDQQTTGTIHLRVAARAGTPAFADRIAIAVPVGETGLFQDVPSCTLSTEKWAVTREDTAFVLDCRDRADFGIDYPFVIALSGPISRNEGQYAIELREHSGATNDRGAFTAKVRRMTFDVVVPEFYLSNVAAHAPGSRTPVTECAADTPITLTWESNGTWFQVLQRDQKAPVYEGSQTTCTIPGIVSDTTFFLIASITGDPTGHKAGFESLFLYDNITVTVREPRLKASTLDVMGDVIAGGPLKAATLSVPGHARLHDVEMESANVSGGIEAGSVNAGALRTKSLNVSEPAALDGGFTSASHPVSMFSAVQELEPGTYLAHTDGLLLGVAWWPANNANGRSFLSASTEGRWFFASGGLPWGGYATSSTLVMPVRRGNNFSFKVDKDGEAPRKWYWCPFGSNGSQPTAARPMRAEPDPPTSLPPDGGATNPLLDLAAIVEELAGKRAPAPLRRRISALLSALRR